ncbi:hypothetical protein BFAG_03322 [Bacteroides fragilis 3_1_12]|uniref:Uncharacterized protein n=1 Tax=Bacteroides fragilis 3_1_12 TaxID=457424 RepID=A0ABN0BP15_BACFG|nr:hypothetical protein BFAG_03322 [Bacteroides fragilis 3_1_12]
MADVIIVSYSVPFVGACVKDVVEGTFRNAINGVYEPAPYLAVGYPAPDFPVIYPVYFLHTFLVTYSAPSRHTLFLLFLGFVGPDIQLYLRAHRHPAAAAALGTGLFGGFLPLPHKKPGRVFHRFKHDARAVTGTAQGNLRGFCHVPFHTASSFFGST